MSDNRTFIVLDGPDFSGKSTLMEAFLKRLDAQATEYVAIREPGCVAGKPSLAEEIRATLIAEREEVVHPETDVILHMGYRVQNVKNVILPALEAGKMVVSDRFIFSTWCLNVQAHLATHPELHDLFAGLMPYVVKGLPEPLTFILDTPRAIRDERANGNVRKKDRYESQGSAVHDRIEAAYMQLKASPSCKFIDGTLPIEEQVDYMLETIKVFRESIQQDLASEAERQKIVTDQQQAGVEKAKSLKEELDADESWDLEKNVQTYVQTYVVELADRLFEGGSDEEVAAATEVGKLFATEMVKNIFERTGQDRTIFHTSRVGQLNQQIHSMLSWGFRRDLWLKQFEQSEASATQH